MTRLIDNRFSWVWAMLAILLVSVHVHAQEQKRAPYNILFILVDDLRPTLGVYGDMHAISPHIDKWAEGAMVFDRAYSNQAVCVASRYNLLLGARSTSSGLYDFGRHLRDAYPNAETLPERFKNEGYYTAAIGKVFHVGHNNYNDEQSWTAPHWHDKVIEYLDSPHQETREEALFANKSWDYAGSLPKGSAWERLDVPDDAYADGRVANEASSRLEELKASNQPFFLAVGFARPHLPFTVPAKYWDLYDPNSLPFPKNQQAPKNAPPFAVKRGEEITQYQQIPSPDQIQPFPEELTRQLIHGYYAGVSYVDAQIGKVLQKLEDTGLADSTIVVLWGDHGYLLGEMGMWTKHVNYELANRIPLLIKHPEMSSGRHSDDFIETVDIYPTLAAIAGIKLPDSSQQPIDGISFAEYLLHPTQALRTSVYHCFPRGGRLGRAVRNKEYRLVAWQDFEGKQEPIYELYRYQNGPVEEENIFREDHPAFLELKAILDSYPKPHPMRPVSAAVEN